MVAAVFLSVVFLGNATRNGGSSAQAYIGGLGGGISALDEVSAARVAADIAIGADLIVADNVQNLADSQEVQIEFASSEGSYLSKPQVVTTNAKTNADITQYVAQAGDTVPSIARKFNVTSDTIRWENGLSGDSISAGTILRILPVSGIRYTVRSGDTPESIAEQYGLGSSAFLIAFNDGEIGGFTAGQKIIIPDGKKPVVLPTFFSSGGGFAFGSSPLYGGNGYSYGYCTYYVANRISVPRNWGNANSWDDGALLSGWIVSSKPVKGAIAQTDRMTYLGHVAFVEEVSADGKMIKYSDMNALAGWNAIGFSDWTPATLFENYIYR